MATTVQQPYNLFAAPKLTKPVQAYDPTKSVQENKAGNGAPSAQNIVSAYQTPQEQLQQAQAQKQTQNQQQKQQFNGDPNSSTAGIDYLNSLYTDPKEEERLRKASVMNQRILAIGDAIRHIGNIANTVNYAPAQQLNSPVQEEQARYEKGKAMRDKANKLFYTYQQQKAAQDARARRFEAEQTYKNNMLKHYQDQDRRLWAQQDETARRNAFLEGLKEKELELKKAYNEGRISIAEYNAQTSRIRAMKIGANTGRGGGGKGMDEYTTTTETTYNYDNLGKKTGSTTTKKRTVNGKQQPTQKTKKANPMGGSSNGKKKNPMS